MAANETEVERMVVRLIGDGSSYEKMWREAKAATDSAEQIIGAGLERISQKIKQWGQSLQSIGTKASLAITAPFALFQRAASQEAAAFDEVLGQMRGINGISQEVVDGFAKTMKDMGPSLGKGPTELAEALYFITSSGLSGEAAIEALSVSAKASAAGLGETKVVADAATSAVNAYGVENLTATRAVEVLTSAVREGKGEASAMAGVFGQMLPSANALGVKFDEVGGLLAFLTKSTGSASLAATGLRGVMAQLMRPTKEAEKVLATMGMSTKTLKDSIGRKGLLQTVVDIKTAFENAGKPITDMFSDMEGLNAVLQLTGPQMEDARKVVENVSNSVGIVDEVFTSATKTIKFGWNAAMSAAKVELINAYQILAPFANKMLEFGNIGIGVWKSLGPEVQKYGLYLLMAAAAIGPLLVGIGTLTVTFGSLLPYLAPIFALLSSMFIPIMTGVAIAIAAVMMFKTQMAAAFESIKAFSSRTFESIKASVASMIEYWTPAFLLAHSLATTVFNGIYEVATFAFEQIYATGVPIFNAIVGWFDMVFQTITGTIGPGFDYLREVVMESFMFLEFAFKNIEPVAQLAFLNMYLGIVRFYGQVQHFFTAAIPAIFKWFMKEWQNVFFTLGDFTMTVLINMGKNIRAVFDNLLDIVRGKVSISEIWTPLTDGFVNAISTLPDIPEREMGALEKQLTNEAAAMGEKVGEQYSEFRNEKLESIKPPEVKTPEVLPFINADSQVIGEAKVAGEKIGAAVGQGVQGEVKKVEGVDFFSVEAASRMQEYFEKIKEQQAMARQGNTAQAKVEGKPMNPEDKKGADKSVGLLASIDKGITSLVEAMKAKGNGTEIKLSSANLGVT